MPPAQRIRPTHARVDLDALVHNAGVARARLGEGEDAPGLLCVVKADAYGHGAVPVSLALDAAADELGLAWFGVALVEEGIALREAGITRPILVLGGAYEGGWDALVTHGLTPTLFRAEHFPAFAAAGGTVAHLKLDTGMGRIGALPGELDEVLEAARTAGVGIDGVLSHFANADLADDGETDAQFERFAAGVARVRNAGFEPSFVHLANSAATLARAKDLAAHTLVRPGLMLYGYRPADWIDADLKPVLTWATAVTHLKTVPPGFKVSYGQTWAAPRQSVIATLPVGYADGYDRHLSGGTPVLVRGQRAPIVGRVCMDMCLVDVTDVPGVQVGDEVLLLGGTGPDRVDADLLAERLGTISYEVLCAIGSRVPRVYSGGGRG